MEQSPTLFHLIDSFFLCDRECGYLLYLSSPCLFFLLLFFMFFLCKTVNMHISVSVILCLYSLLKHIIKINKKKKNSQFPHFSLAQTCDPRTKTYLQ